MEVERRYVEILAEYVERKLTPELASLAEYKRGKVVKRSTTWNAQLQALGFNAAKFRRHVSTNYRHIHVLFVHTWSELYARNILH
jgi:hypothetical protein